MTLKVYGPYLRADGRRHVIHYDTVTKTRRTQSYPRYLMEKHLGRKLEDWEQVDHINNDHSDDRIENYQLLTLKENIEKHVEEKLQPALVYNFTCPVCGKEAEIPYRQYQQNQLVQDKAGPYCSRSCAGKRHH